MELCFLNMFIELWRSLSGKVKTKLLLSKKLIGTVRPTILWVLPRTYQGTASQVIRVTMKELDNYKKIITDTHMHNINSFCHYGQLLIAKLSDAGEEDTQVIEKLSRI